MAQVNPLTREVLIKLVYYGPGLGGKTTTLQKVHAASPPETRGKIVSLATPVDRTLYFDFMPLRVEPVNGYPVRLQLFTVPGQVYFNATRKLVLTGADGVVFVADSQTDRQDANLESLQNLQANLEEQHRSLSAVPHVMQYNKRDLPDIATLAELNEALNLHGASCFESSASLGEGVVRPLDELVRLVLNDLESRNVFSAEGSGLHARAHDFTPAREGIKESLAQASQLWQEPAESGPDGERRSSLPQGSDPSEPARAPALYGGRNQGPESPRIPRFDGRPSSELPAHGRGPSWASLFLPEQAREVAQLEDDLIRGDFRAAILRMDAAAAELLAHAAAASGLSADERKPGQMALLLGVPGERWLSFRMLVRDARTGSEIAETAALAAYALLLEVNRLRLRLGPLSTP